MKRIMNSLLFTAGVLTLLYAGIANATTGFFYNPERDGEGIIVTVEKDVLAFAFFTYFDPDWSSEIPPTVSPAPPEPNIVLPQCVPEITTPPGVEIPPVVSPKPPPAPPGVDEEYTGGVPIWYTGFGAYKDGIALGDMYYYKPTSYPYSFDNLLGTGYKVATFLLDGNKEGFEMYLDCNELLPTSMYMCNNVMTFNTLIIGE